MTAFFFSLLITVAAANSTISPTAGACPNWVNENPNRPLPAVEDQLIQGVNTARAKKKLTALIPEPRLQKVARKYAETLAKAHQLSHQGPDGKDAETRVKDAKIFDWEGIGENLASTSIFERQTFDQNDKLISTDCRAPEQVVFAMVDGWIHSPGHFANMIRPEFTHIGSGVAVDEADQSVIAVHLFMTQATCGFAQGPCCRSPDKKYVSCQEPFRCKQNLCR